MRACLATHPQSEPILTFVGFFRNAQSLNFILGRLSKVLDHKRVPRVQTDIRCKYLILIPADEQILLLEVFLDDFCILILIFSQTGRNVRGT